MTKLTFILLLFTLLSCTSSKKENQEVKKDSIQSTPSSPVDSGRLELENRRRELEKIGYNYSTKIISTENIVYDNKKLSFVQDLLDSSNVVKGKMYVELLNDSSFKRLYILDGKELKYFIGDLIFTNKVDTTEYSNSDNRSFHFAVRWKHYFTIYLDGSDLLTIQYLNKKKKFDHLRTP